MHLFSRYIIHLSCFDVREAGLYIVAQNYDTYSVPFSSSILSLSSSEYPSFSPGEQFNLTLSALYHVLQGRKMLQKMAREFVGKVMLFRHGQPTRWAYYGEKKKKNAPVMLVIIVIFLSFFPSSVYNRIQIMLMKYFVLELSLRRDIVGVNCVA